MSLRRLAILLGIAAAAWIVLLLRPGQHTPAAKPEPAASAPPPAPAPHMPKPAPRTVRPELAAKQSTPAIQARAPNTELARGPSTPALDARARAAAGMQPAPPNQRYTLASTRFEQEKKVEPWASQRTQVIRDALRYDNMAHLVRAIECRSTLCRIELNAGTETIGALRRNTHFSKEVGLQTIGNLEGPEADRRLVMYAARPGTRL